MNGENVFWDPMSMSGKSASILAIGDSWFWYPFPGGSLLQQLGPLVESRSHVVFALGYNGAEAVDFVQGKYKKQVGWALRTYGPDLSAVWISGGGNDFAGLNDLRPLLRGDCSDATTAAACFIEGPSWPSLDWLMSVIRESYAMLIGRVFTACNEHVKVLVHTYDYAIPTGKSVFGGRSWLKESLDVAKVPEALRADCVRIVIDRFAAMQLSLVAGSLGRIVQVDSRGVLAADDWANELHPKPKGFRKIAQQAWRPELEKCGLAAPR